MIAKRITSQPRFTKNSWNTLTYVKSDSQIDVNRDNLPKMNFETGEYEVLIEGLYHISIQITIITKII